MVFSKSDYKTKNLFSSTTLDSLVIYLLRAGINCLLTCSAKRIKFFSAPYSALDIAFYRLIISWRSWVWKPFHVLEQSFSNPWIWGFRLYRILMICPISDIFSLILGSCLSIDLRLFICLTKSETFPVEVFNAFIDSAKYFPS